MTAANSGVSRRGQLGTGFNPRQKPVALATGATFLAARADAVLRREETKALMRHSRNPICLSSGHQVGRYVRFLPQTLTPFWHRS